ncbi:MAG: MotA/TolQ/ExbB proton channel family protein [Planctomycetes bacterium]|nr:MotA/TolQ/ExbB proton channel family protein [Planctomycetota bacterium]
MELTMTSMVLGQAIDAASPLEVQNLWDFVRKGGIMMIPIGLCSLVALTVMVERLISLRRRNVIPDDFLPGLKKVLKKMPADKAEALAYCRRSDSPVANVFAAGIKRIDRSIEGAEKHIREAGEREVLNLRKYLRVLSVIASVAPLMGLLGTILGMIRAFQTVAASPDALGKTELLAEGIYEAMITTAAGLLVAIPVLVCFHWISAKTDRLVMDIDQMSMTFVDEVVEGSFGAEQAETVAAGPGDGEAAEDMPASPVQVATS